MKKKKFTIADRMSFVFFALYYITYLILPLLTGNYRYFIFIIIPSIFLAALLINVLLKHNKIGANSMSKVTKWASLLSALTSSEGSLGPSIYMAGVDWEDRIKDIKRYPSIVPAWLFIVFLMTSLSDFVFYAFVDKSVSARTLFYYSVMSLVFVLLGQVSSTLALYYADERKFAAKSWRSILIIILGLILIIAIVGGPDIYKEIKIHREKKLFEERIDRINEVLEENK